jgi:L-fuconolactonase
MKIDAHQHFWRYEPVRDAWITPDMSVIRRDFLPADLQPLLDQHGFDGCVAVQADQSETETQFLLDLAAAYPFIRGVVGWTDLQAANLPERLDHWAMFPALKGFRHILQGEKPAFMLQPAFKRGIAELGRRGYTYDILVFPGHLPAVLALLKGFDNQRFVIDHLAKPYIRRGLIRQWTKDLRRVARHPNVCCKLSGMVTEADWADWKPGDFTPYLEAALEAFGPDRLLYGSDWPVCLLAADYTTQLRLVSDFIARLTPTEQARVMGANAMHFYQLT